MITREESLQLAGDIRKAHYALRDAVAEGVDNVNGPGPGEVYRAVKSLRRYLDQYDDGEVLAGLFKRQHRDYNDN
jgi:hypothetical protein